jgi:hypothetical protein
MQRALGLLACALAVGCRRPPHPAGAGGDAALVANAGPRDDAGVIDGSDDASDGRAHDEVLEVFLEAARTNLSRPYPADQPDSLARYAEAATELQGRRGFFGAGPVYVLVAETLARSDDTRGHRALAAWANDPRARPHLPDLVLGMTTAPRAEWLEVARMLLADPSFAEVRGQVLASPGGLIGQALGMFVATSLQGQALGLALGAPGPEGRALVQSYANDRAKSAPDPRTLRALTCGPGQVRVEIEAQALASLRILALSMLGERAELTAIVTDPREPALVRHWAKRMLEGPVDVSKLGWQSRLGWRDKRNVELGMMDIVSQDASPCVSVRPRSLAVPEIP